MNLTGLTTKELNSYVEYCARPALQEAAQAELVRRISTGEQHARIGRRAMGNDSGRQT